MAISEERLKILKLIQDGKITPEEGIALLDALEESTSEPPRGGRGSTPPTPPTPPIPPETAGRWLRVRVTDTDTGKSRANIRLPLSMVTAGMKMGRKFVPEVEGLELDTLSEAIRNGTVGQIVDVFDDEDGEHVEVFIE